MAYMNLVDAKKLGVEVLMPDSLDNCSGAVGRMAVSSEK